MERNEKRSFDTASLEKQRLQLEKGKSRLIDSYADGIIEKADFEPRMQQLKSRLEQIEQQIQESRRHGATQSELFLVINARSSPTSGAVILPRSPGFPSWKTSGTCTSRLQPA
ncbi:hypothetical protein R69927_07723 [Paraburkholderia domus]|nr:hypothetical protein R69927_07723 [Paraburkholderia domus]